MKSLIWVIIGLCLISSFSHARPLILSNSPDSRELKLMGRVLQFNLADCKRDLFNTKNQKFWRCKVKVDSSQSDHSEAVFTPKHFEERYACGSAKACIISAYIYFDLVTISVRSPQWWKAGSSGQLLNKDEAETGLQNFFRDYGSSHPHD